MTLTMRVLIFVLFQLWHSHSLNTGWQELKTSRSWEFAARFCYRRYTEDGRLRYRVRHRPEDQLQILVYTEGWKQFSAVNSATYTRYTCAKRLMKATEIINLKPNADEDDRDDDDRYDVDSDGYITTVGEHRFHSRKNKWAFVAFANCASKDSECNTFNGYDGTLRTYCQSGIDVKYEFSMINPGSGKMYEHFSADERGILPAHIFFFFTQTILLVIAFVIRLALVRQRKYHHTARMVIRACLFQWLSIVVGLVYYSEYANHGRVMHGPLIASQAFFIVSDILMVLLFIVLAKGWTIVRRKISVQGRVKIAIYICTYLCVSIGCLAAFYTLYNPEEIPYYYGSPPGVALAVLRVFAALWFYYAVYTTQSNFNMKKRFYRKFTIVGLLWMLYIPILALLGLGIEDTTRNITLNVIQLLCVSFGQYALVFMYNPSTRFNRSFPFHAKTSDELGMRKGVKRWADNMRSTQRGAGADGGGDGGVQINTTVSVTGGLGSGRSQDGKISLHDGFERVHLARLKRVHQDLEERIGLLQLHSHELGNALGLLDFGGSIDEILQDEPESRPMWRPQSMQSGASRSWLPRRPQQQQMPPGPAQQPMRPRGPLDQALDDALPQHSFAAQRGADRGGPGGAR